MLSLDLIGQSRRRVPNQPLNYLTEIRCYVIFELLSQEAVLTPGFILRGGGFMKNIWIKLILILILIWAVTMVIVITIKNT